MGGSNVVTIGPVPDAQSDGVQWAAINMNAVAATIIAPVTGKRIFVFGMHISATTAVAVVVQDVSGSGTVNLTGACALAQGVPMVLPWQNYPWYTCAAGDALVFSLSSSTGIAGRIGYMQG